jgi:hypothetical protein
MKKLIIILIVFFPFFLFGQEIELKKRITIDQTEELISEIRCFSVSEDGHLILPDFKAGNIKIYDQTGTLLKKWGNPGPGPNEFGMPVACDYHDSRFALLDLGKNNISVYKKKDLEFTLENNILNLGTISDIRFYKNNIVIDGHTYSRKNKPYAVYMIDCETKDKVCLLTEDEKLCDEYQPSERALLGLISHHYVKDDFLFFVWEGTNTFIRYELKGKQYIEIEGKKTKNYRKPKVTKEMAQARRDRSGEKERIAKRKFSWSSFIFADETHIGLIYKNYEENNWIYFIQLYDSDGRFLFEKKLSETYNYGRFGQMIWYNPHDKNLFVLNRKLDEKDFTDIYEVFIYSIN